MLKMMAPPRHESKTRLLDAALRVVRAKGYGATRIEDVCAEAGLTKGSFFHHFKSKEDLARSAAAHWEEFTSVFFAGAPYHSPPDPLDRLLAYVDFRKAILKGELPEFTCFAGTIVQEVYRTHPEIRDACERSIDRHARTLEADIGEAMRIYGVAGDWTAESLALFTQAVIQGAFILAKARESANVAVQSLDHLRRYLELLITKEHRPAESHISSEGSNATRNQRRTAMKLYGFGPTRSLRALWGLKELDADFEFVPVNLLAGEHKHPDFLRLNPAGKLPVLVDEDVVVTESAAIVLYLAEKYREKGLLPADLKERAQVYRWVMFAMTELEQPLWRITKHTMLYPEHKRLPQDIALASDEFAAMASVLDRHMEGRRFIVGDRITVADCVTAYVIDWGNEQKLVDHCPRLLAYLDRMYARPTAPQRIAEAFAAIRAAA